MVESLLSVDILSVSCGNEHVVVVGGNGDVYAWGRGAGGRLGLGNEEDHCTPQKVPMDTMYRCEDQHVSTDFYQNVIINQI